MYVIQRFPPSRTTTSLAPVLLSLKASTTTLVEELARFHSDAEADADADADADSLHEADVCAHPNMNAWLIMIKLISNLTVNFQILTAAHNLKKIGPNE